MFDDDSYRGEEIFQQELTQVLKPPIKLVHCFTIFETYIKSNLSLEAKGYFSTELHQQIIDKIIFKGWDNF